MHKVNNLKTESKMTIMLKTVLRIFGRCWILGRKFDYAGCSYYVKIGIGFKFANAERDRIPAGMLGYGVTTPAIGQGMGLDHPTI